MTDKNNNSSSNDSFNKEFRDLIKSIDDKLYRIDERILNNSTSISSIEGRFTSNSTLFNYLNEQISKIKDDMSDMENELRSIKTDYLDLRKGIYGRSEFGEGKTISEKIETSFESMDKMGKRIDTLQEMQNISMTRLSLLETEKEKIQRMVNEFATKTIYELALINFYQSSKSFFRVRFNKIKTSVSFVANKLAYSAIFRVLLALVTLILSAPIVEEIRKVIEEIITNIMGN